jgi:hypothetical protein
MSCFRPFVVLLLLTTPIAHAAEMDEGKPPTKGGGPVCCTDAARPPTPVDNDVRTPPSSGGGPVCCSDADVLGKLKEQKLQLQKNEQQLDQIIQEFEKRRNKE